MRLKVRLLSLSVPLLLLRKLSAVRAGGCSGADDDVYNSLQRAYNGQPFVYVLRLTYNSVFAERIAGERARQRRHLPPPRPLQPRFLICRTYGTAPKCPLLALSLCFCLFIRLSLDRVHLYTCVHLYVRVSERIHPPCD